MGLVSQSPPDPPPQTLEETLTTEQHRAFLLKTQQVAHIGAWVAELDGSRKLSWSAETYRIFGVPVGDFGGTLDAFQRLIHPDDQEALVTAFWTAVAERKPLDVEHRIVTPIGGIRWVHEQADIVLGADGRPVRLIGAVQDVTDRRTLELQLRHAQKMDAVGRLAGGVAHDLNNALTTIAGYTELALAVLADTDPARADVEEIRRAAARAEAVTRKLLAFSRQQQLFESHEIDLNDLVSTMLHLLERTLGSNVSVHTDLAAALPPIVADAGQVEQAIVNLALNARDAMPTGGNLVISTSAQIVAEPLARAHASMPPGKFVLLKVTDTGHGMDRDTQARIFEPFFTTKEPGKGTGLGLAMVYGTVKQSSGFVFVDSEVGCGATFSLYFPAARETTTGTDADARSMAASTILVAEDEPSILNLIAMTLGRDGYRVLKAGSGPEALKLAMHHDPIDLLLTDSMMPGISGPELARTLLAQRPRLPIIIMSGNTQMLGGSETLGDSVALMEKPFTPTELRERVRAMLKP